MQSLQRILATQDGLLKANFDDNAILTYDPDAGAVIYTQPPVFSPFCPPPPSPLPSLPSPRLQLVEYCTNDIRPRLAAVLHIANTHFEHPIPIPPSLESFLPSLHPSSPASLSFSAAYAIRTARFSLDPMIAAAAGCVEFTQNGSVSLDAEDRHAHILLDETATRVFVTFPCLVSSSSSSSSHAQSYQYQWVTQSHSIAHYPPRWEHPILLALALRAENKRRRATTATSRAAWEDEGEGLVARLSAWGAAEKERGGGRDVELPTCRGDAYWIHKDDTRGGGGRGGGGGNAGDEPASSARRRAALSRLDSLASHSFFHDISTSLYPPLSLSRVVWEWTPRATLLVLPALGECEAHLHTDHSTLRTSQAGAFFHHFITTRLGDEEDVPDRMRVYARGAIPRTVHYGMEAREGSRRMTMEDHEHRDTHASYALEAIVSQLSIFRSVALQPPSLPPPPREDLLPCAPNVTEPERATRVATTRMRASMATHASPFSSSPPPFSSSPLADAEAEGILASIRLEDGTSLLAFADASILARYPDRSLLLWHTALRPSHCRIVHGASGQSEWVSIALPMGHEARVVPVVEFAAWVWGGEEARGRMAERVAVEKAAVGAAAAAFRLAGGGGGEGEKEAWGRAAAVAGRMPASSLPLPPPPPLTAAEALRADPSTWERDGIPLPRIVALLEQRTRDTLQSIAGLSY